jgi:hypothetical protein
MGKKPGFTDFITANRRALAIALEQNIQVWMYRYQGVYHLSSVTPSIYLAKRPEAEFINFVQASRLRKI